MSQADHIIEASCAEVALAAESLRFGQEKESVNTGAMRCLQLGMLESALDEANRPAVPHADCLEKVFLAMPRDGLAVPRGRKADTTVSSRIDAARGWGAALVHAALVHDRARIGRLNPDELSVRDSLVVRASVALNMGAVAMVSERGLSAVTLAITRGVIFPLRGTYSRECLPNQRSRSMGYINAAVARCGFGAGITTRAQMWPLPRQ